MRVNGFYYDGISNEDLAVTAVVSDAGIDIREPESGETIVVWPSEATSVVFQSANGKTVDFCCYHDNHARLRLEGSDLADQLESSFPGIMPNKSGEWAGAAGILAYMAGGIIAAILLLIWFADLIVLSFPASWERSMGATLAQSVDQDQTHGGICSSKAGDEALQKLEDRLLSNSAARYPLDIEVINDDTLNAFALPGGYIRIYAGLIKALENPETLAGILAHEIGHVEEQHSLRRLSRSLLLAAGAEILTGGSGVSGALVNAYGLSFSRSMEREADQFAIDRMQAVGLDPADTADFFQLLIDQDLSPEMSSVGELFSTHPLSSERIKMLKAASSPKSEPALTAAEWRALKSICKN